MTAEQFNSAYPVGSAFMWQPFPWLQGKGIRVATTGQAIDNGKQQIVPIYKGDLPRHASLDELTPVEN